MAPILPKPLQTIGVIFVKFYHPFFPQWLSHLVTWSYTKICATYPTMLGNQLYDNQANFNVTAPFSEGEYHTFLFSRQLRCKTISVSSSICAYYFYLFYLYDLHFDKWPTQPLRALILNSRFKLFSAFLLGGGGGGARGGFCCNAHGDSASFVLHICTARMRPMMPRGQQLCMIPPSPPPPLCTKKEREYYCNSKLVYNSVFRGFFLLLSYSQCEVHSVE